MNVIAPAFDRSLLVQQKMKPKKIIFSQFQSSKTKRIVLATAVNNLLHKCLCRQTWNGSHREILIGKERERICQKSS
jgi:hypothetical protein